MYLVLNLGLKSIRAIVFDNSGKIIANNSKPLTTILNGSRVEQDANEWLIKGLEVISLATQIPSIKSSIKFFSVTASSCCVVPVSKDAEPLTNVIMVSDKRASIEVEQIKDKESYQRLSQGRPEFEVKSSLMLPKILWIKNNQPDIFAKTHYMLSPNDYFAYKFSNNPSTDILNAEKCFFDEQSWSYPTELLGDLDIDVALLPKVTQIGEMIGELTNKTKSEMGIETNSSVQFINTTYDAICAFYGSGVSNEGDTCDVSGTVTSLRMLSHGRVKVNSSSIFSQYQPAMDLSIIGGSNNLGGGLIEWAKQAFYSESTSPYEEMEAEARLIANGCDGVTFLPYLMGERAPYWNDNARGVFFGLARNHNRKHLIRSIFESAGFSIRNLLEEIEQDGRQVASIKFSGGLSRINLIARIKADILGKEVHLLDEFETTALGAFMLMGLSTGLFKSLDESSSVVKTREIILPDMEAHEFYTEVFNLYKKIYQNLLDCYELHSDMYKEDIYRSSEKLENM